MGGPRPRGPFWGGAGGGFSWGGKKKPPTPRGPPAVLRDRREIDRLWSWRSRTGDGQAVAAGWCAARVDNHATFAAWADTPPTDQLTIKKNYD